MKEESCTSSLDQQTCMQGLPTRCCGCESDDYLASCLRARAPRCSEAEASWVLEQLPSDPNEVVINRATKEGRCDGLFPSYKLYFALSSSTVSSPEVEPALHCCSWICSLVKLQCGRVLVRVISAPFLRTLHLLL